MDNEKYDAEGDEDSNNDECKWPECVHAIVIVVIVIA